MAEFIVSILPFGVTILVLLILAYLRKSEKPLILAHSFLSLCLFFLYFSEKLWIEAENIGSDLYLYVILCFCSVLLLCNDYRTEFRYYSEKHSAFSISCCINTIFSITIYFAMIFNMHSLAVPDSFNNVNTNDYLSRALEFYYFSLTTFTTVGFGDITATTTCARFLVLLEIAVAFYLMVIVANFVYIVNKSDNSENNVSEVKSTTKDSKKNNKKKKKGKARRVMSENAGNNNQQLTIEEIHKELDLIQACITRMANNSFFIKGWLISIYAVVLALMGETLNSLLICFILMAVNIAFWWLDGYFLQAEKVYRKIYAWVLKERPLNNRELLYDLNPNNFMSYLQDVKSMWQVLCSPTLLIFYGLPFLSSFIWFIVSIC